MSIHVATAMLAEGDAVQFYSNSYFKNTASSSFTDMSVRNIFSSMEADYNTWRDCVEPLNNWSMQQFTF